MSVKFTTGSVIGFATATGGLANLQTLFGVLTDDATTSVEDAIAECTEGGTISMTITVKSKE